MATDPGKEYEIGYGKPPKATRFQKGRSGNPSGRPKKAVPDVDPGNTLQSIDNEEISLVIDGKRKVMRKAEVHFRQLFAKSIKGDLVAARLVAKMAAKYFGPEEEGPSEILWKVMPDDYWNKKYKQALSNKR
jgi:hypothetical protein